MKEQVKTMRIIHLALTIGVTIAYLFLSEISSIDELFTLPVIEGNSFYFALIPIVAYLLSNMMFKNMLSKVDKKLKIDENLGAYQTAALTRWAILEGAAFIIIFNKPDFILFGIVTIIYLALLSPTESKITSHLKNL